MARTIHTQNLYAPATQSLARLKGSVQFCLQHWVKLLGYSFLILFGSAFLYGFGLWATGSYKVLSDDPTVWQSSIEFLNHEDISTPLLNDKNTLFVGSSSVRLFEDLETFFPEYNVLKKGFGGAKINDVNFYKEQLIFQYNPQLIVMYIGINDILYREHEGVTQLTTDLFTLTNEIVDRFPNSHLVLLAVRPLEDKEYGQAITTYNQHLNTYASSHSNVHYIDVNPALQLANNKPNPEYLMWDGLHLNKQGYAMWGTQIHQQLNALNLIN